MSGAVDVLSGSLGRLGALLAAEPAKLLRSSDSGVVGPARLWVTAKAFGGWTVRPTGGRAAVLEAEVDEAAGHVVLSVVAAPCMFPRRVVRAPEWNDDGMLVDFVIDGFRISEELSTLIDDTGRFAALVSETRVRDVAVVPLAGPSQPDRRQRADELSGDSIEVDVVPRSNGEPATPTVTRPITDGSVYPVAEGFVGDVTLHFPEEPLFGPAAQQRPGPAPAIDELTLRLKGRKLRGEWHFRTEPIDDIAERLAAWCL